MISLNLRLPIVCYAIVMALMLFQTGETGYGTLLALLAMAVTFMSVLCSKNLRKSHFNILLLFAVVVLVNSIFQGYCTIHDLMKFFIQVLLTYFMSRLVIADNENKFLRSVFEFSMLIYALLIIHSCLFNNIERLIHGHIQLFGASFDPNYIGIPLVAVSIFLFDDIIVTKGVFKKILLSFIYVTVIVSIILTSSRGNSLSFMIGFVMILLYHSQVVGVKKTKWWLVLFIVVFAIVFVDNIYYLFEENIERMTDFGEDADNGRFSIWKLSINLWMDYPILGAGLNSVPIISGDPHSSHSTYIQLLAETGLIGTIIFVIFIWNLLRRCAFYGRVYLIVLVTLLFQIAFLNTLDNRCVWGLLGWFVMLSRR